MNIAYTSSNEYAQYMGISLLSLLDNNLHVVEMNIFVISAGISDDNKNKIMSIANKYKRNLVFIDKTNDLKSIVDEYNLPYFRENYNPYFKIFPDMLGLKLDKLLFLDADLIICGDIVPLYETDLDGRICGIVPEISAYWGYGDDKEVINMHRYYYNTGVIIWDMKQVRERQFTQKLLEASRNYPNVMRLADQSLLSIGADDDDVYPLHYKYNLNCCLISRPKDKYKPVFDKYHECGFDVPKRHPFSEKNIVIYHFESCRPWIRWRMAAYGNKYLRYWKHSPWKGVPRISMFSDIKADYLKKSSKTIVRIPVIGNAYIAIAVFLKRYFPGTISFPKRFIKKHLHIKQVGAYREIRVFGRNFLIFSKKIALSEIYKKNVFINQLKKQDASNKKIINELQKKINNNTQTGTEM